MVDPPYELIRRKHSSKTGLVGCLSYLITTSKAECQPSSNINTYHRYPRPPWPPSSPSPSFPPSARPKSHPPGPHAPVTHPSHSPPKPPSKTPPFPHMPYPTSHILPLPTLTLYSPSRLQQTPNERPALREREAGTLFRGRPMWRLLSR